MRRVLTGVAALAAVAAVVLVASPAEASPTLNQKVVQFAKARMGKQVGNGECWTLAADALSAAGAHRPGTAGYGVYVFGKQISRKALQSGDVIQFENVRFEHRGPDGAKSWNEFPHHTAIVTGVQGNRITLLHQNVNGKRTVQTGVIDMADFQRGTMRYFRPQPR
jgi:hypothetical protein